MQRLAPLALALWLGGCVVVTVGPDGLSTGPIGSDPDAMFPDETPGVYDEDTFLVLLNDEREGVSVAAVTVDPLLNEAAQRHADDMAENGFFSHIGSDGSDVAVRVTETGYAWSNLAENVFRGSTAETAAIETWMDSPSHRAAMLDALYSEVGVGQEADYYVLVLADPR